MENLSFIELLMAANWKSDNLSFKEKASRKAAHYFSYQNSRNNQLGLAVFPDEKFIRFRVFDMKTNEVSYLEIAIDNSTETIVGKIIEKQEELVQNDTFSFYFGISSLGEVSVLAWEQFEDDYR
jgi:hypothetical protein